MTYPQVADGTDIVHIWRVAANILNQQTWKDDVGWSYSLRFGLVPDPEDINRYEME